MTLGNAYKYTGDIFPFILVTNQLQTSKLIINKLTVSINNFVVAAWLCTMKYVVVSFCKTSIIYSTIMNQILSFQDIQISFNQWIQLSESLTVGTRGVGRVSSWQGTCNLTVLLEYIKVFIFIGWAQPTFGWAWVPSSLS